MKYLVPAFIVLLAFPMIVLAKGPRAMEPSDDANRNVNQVQNRGEETQVQTQEREEEREAEEEQEREGTGAGKYGANRDENAVDNMSRVAREVQRLQQTRTGGGIGQQVRQIAKEQSGAQTLIQEEVDKLASRGWFVRLLTGTDIEAVKNLKALLSQNVVRIQQLEDLKDKLTSAEDIAAAEVAIKSLKEQNAALQERVTAEEQTKSLLGWLVRFLAR